MLSSLPGEDKLNHDGKNSKEVLSCLFRLLLQAQYKPEMLSREKKNTGFFYFFINAFTLCFFYIFPKHLCPFSPVAFYCFSMQKPRETYLKQQMTVTFTTKFTSFITFYFTFSGNLCSCVSTAPYSTMV